MTTGDGSLRGKNPGTITVSAPSITSRPEPISRLKPDVDAHDARMLGAHREVVAFALDRASEDLGWDREVEDDDIGHDERDDVVHHPGF